MILSARQLHTSSPTPLLSMCISHTCECSKCRVPLSGGSGLPLVTESFFHIAIFAKEYYISKFRIFIVACFYSTFSMWFGQLIFSMLYVVTSTFRLSFDGDFCQRLQIRTFLMLSNRLYIPPPSFDSVAYFCGVLPVIIHERSEISERFMLTFLTFILLLWSPPSGYTRVR